MEEVLSGSERRKKIIQILKQSTQPLSGGRLGSETNVSRQVVVQDIALLRAEGYDIMATPKGYVLNLMKQAARIIKVCHTTDQTEEELNTIIDLGGCVVDVCVNHRAYGKVTAPLNIRSRRDIQLFIHQLQTGKSSPLSNVTSGYHFHKITAESEEILDEIEAALLARNMLTEVFPYEQELTEI